MASKKYSHYDDGQLLQTLQTQLTVHVDALLIEEYKRRTSLTLVFAESADKITGKSLINQTYKAMLENPSPWRGVEPNARYLSTEEFSELAKDPRFETTPLSFAVELVPSHLHERLGSHTVKHVLFLKEFGERLRKQSTIAAVIGPKLVTSDTLALNLALSERDLLY